MTETPEPSRRPVWMYETPSPRSSYLELAEASMFANSKSSDLVGVLEQVSELTMEDDAFNVVAFLQTPVALNPRPMANNPPLLKDDDDSKRKPSPFLTCRKKVRRSNSSLTPSKLSSAPPLPSSPDLSAGGEIRMIPPQFSPLAASHSIDIEPLLQRQLENEDELMVSPLGLPPVAPPPTPEVSSLPPPMPWFETPEQGPRKKVVALNHALQMKKGHAFVFP